MAIYRFPYVDIRLQAHTIFPLQWVNVWRLFGSMHERFAELRGNRITRDDCMTLDADVVAIEENCYPSASTSIETEGEISFQPSQVMKMAPHGFELLLVAGVSYISWGIGVPIASVLHHAFFAIGTIAAVHCVDAFRTVGERITQLGEFEEAARKIGIEIAPEVYRKHLKRRKIERASYGVFTAFNCFCWVCGAFTYTLFIRMELAIAGGQRPPFEHLSLGMIHGLAAFFAFISFALATYKVYKICETPTDLEIGHFAAHVKRHVEDVIERKSFNQADDQPVAPSKPR